MTRKKQEVLDWKVCGTYSGIFCVECPDEEYCQKIRKAILHDIKVLEEKK